MIDVLRDGRAIRINFPGQGRAFSSKAKQFTFGLVFGKAVTVKVKELDRYGRLVARIIIDVTAFLRSS